MANWNAPEDLVVLNVGGLRLETTKSTLTALYPHSLLAAMVNETWDPKNSENSENTENSPKKIWIDSDWKIFLWILEFLRRGPNSVLPRDLADLERLRAEALHYVLPEFVELIDAKISELIPPNFQIGDQVKMKFFTPGESFNYCPNPSEMKFVASYDSMAEPDLCPKVICDNCNGIFNERLYDPNPKKLFGEFLRRPNGIGSGCSDGISNSNGIGSMSNDIQQPIAIGSGSEHDGIKNSNGIGSGCGDGISNINGISNSNGIRSSSGIESGSNDIQQPIAIGSSSGDEIRQSNAIGTVIFVHKNGKCVDVFWPGNNFNLVTHISPEFLKKF